MRFFHNNYFQKQLRKLILNKCKISSEIPIDQCSILLWSTFFISVFIKYNIHRGSEF